MTVYDLGTGKEFPAVNNPVIDPASPTFVCCVPGELESFKGVFDFDMSTLIDCMNFDENIRLNSYQGYDFLSMIYFTLQDEKIHLSEVNLYVGEHYLVLVLQDDDEPSRRLEAKVLEKLRSAGYGPKELSRLYYAIFEILLTDMSETMERVEDEINAIEKQLGGKVDKSNFRPVARMRENVYVIRKQLRPLLYVGDQLLVDENHLVTHEYMRYFKNVDIRINKLFDFSVSLQEYANQLSNIYESRLTMQTNEVINKLTIITLFFGPLTVITGVYGMNFTFMPELEWYYGYPVALGLMGAVSFIIYLVLKKKKWL